MQGKRKKNSNADYLRKRTERLEQDIRTGMSVADAARSNGMSEFEARKLLRLNQY